MKNDDDKVAAGDKPKLWLDLLLGASNETKKPLKKLVKPLGKVAKVATEIQVDYEGVRTILWFDFLLKKSLTTKAIEFEEWINRADLHDTSLESIKWGLYASGQQSPKPFVISAVENAIVGSALIYSQGDADLPLLAILKGSVSDCDRLLNEVLLEHNVLSLNMSVRDKFYAMLFLLTGDNLGFQYFEYFIEDLDLDLFEIKMSEYLDLGLKLINEIPESWHQKRISLGIPTGYWAPNSVWINEPPPTYKDMINLPFKSGAKEIFIKNINRKIVLAIVALIYMGFRSNDKFLKQLSLCLVNWLTSGIIEGFYGKYVNNYLDVNLHKLNR